MAGMDLARRGEFYFHDASICLEGWQGCSSCHPGGGRSDVLTTRNPHDRHGKTSDLTRQELDDLCEYLLSL